MASGSGKSVCVTGAGGYIASWIVLRLLQKGYNVRGTVRDTDDPKKCEHLKKLEGAEERLTLLKADILDYDSLLPAIRGCDAVFHTACPVATKFDKAEDVLEPAIKGTENVLKACSAENVKRVIMTSSGAAIFGDPNRPADKIVDESCWSDASYCRETQSWYPLAKTESEKAAWEYSKKSGLDVVVICPVFVFGPLLQTSLNASVEYLRDLVNGSAESYPNRYMSVVDVRDVAEAHVVALEDSSASGRYFCVERGVHLRDLIDCIKKHFPHLTCPQKCVGEEVTGINPDKICNKKVVGLIKKMTPHEQTLIDTIRNLQDKGFLPNLCSSQLL